MQLEIELKNPKYCNGCPCFVDYFLNSYCMFYREMISSKETDGTAVYLKVRPAQCIEKNGM